MDLSVRSQKNQLTVFGFDSSDELQSTAFPISQMAYVRELPPRVTSRGTATVSSRVTSCQCSLDAGSAAIGRLLPAEFRRRHDRPGGEYRRYRGAESDPGDGG